LIGRWKRIPLDDVQRIEVIEGHTRPGVKIQRTGKKMVCYTPFDFYADEMEFDRTILEKAIAIIRTTRADFVLEGAV
jgi:hypothetical protein